MTVMTRLIRYDEIRFAVNEWKRSIIVAMEPIMGVQEYRAVRSSNLPFGEYYEVVDFEGVVHERHETLGQLLWILIEKGWTILLITINL